jgi:hypothetical protein
MGLAEPFDASILVHASIKTQCARPIYPDPPYPPGENRRTDGACLGHRFRRTLPREGRTGMDQTRRNGTWPGQTPPRRSGIDKD